MLVQQLFFTILHVVSLALTRHCIHSSRRSNGSGKTSLVMSVLWALTGSVDARPLPDAKVSDVINDSSKVRVSACLDGLIVFFFEQN